MPMLNFKSCFGTSSRQKHDPDGTHFIDQSFEECRVQCNSSSNLSMIGMRNLSLMVSLFNDL